VPVRHLGAGGHRPRPLRGRHRRHHPDGRWTLTDGVPAAPGPGSCRRSIPTGSDGGAGRDPRGPQLVQLDDDGGRVASLGRSTWPSRSCTGRGARTAPCRGCSPPSGCPTSARTSPPPRSGSTRAAMKAAFAAAGLPQVAYLTVHRTRWRARGRRRPDRAAGRAAVAVVHQAGPAGFLDRHLQGDGIGELDAAMAEALATTTSSSSSRGSRARELEVGVLGDADMEVTRPGEIVPSASSTTSRPSTSTPPSCGSRPRSRRGRATVHGAGPPGLPRDRLPWAGARGPVPRRRRRARRQRDQHDPGVHARVDVPDAVGGRGGELPAAGRPAAVVRAV
jgi:hypothetical protein